MIKAHFCESCPELTVQGHAGYGEYGKDVVCAGASTLVFTLCHELIRLGLEHERDLSPGYARLKTNGEARELFRFVAAGFMVLAESYPGCVEVIVNSEE